MQELETLLNSLIKMVWKPKDREVISIALDPEFTKSEWKNVFYCSCRDWFWFYADLRWLVSLESRLWPFVCENKLYKEHNGKIERYFDFNENDYLFHYARDYQYRLLESALIPEEKLAGFFSW